VAGRRHYGVAVVIKRDLLLDGSLAAVLAVTGVLEALVPFSSAVGEGSRPLTAVLAVWTCGVLVLRRRAPLLTVVLATAAFPLVDLLGDPLVLFWGGFVPYAVATYSVARHADHRRGLAGAAVVAGLLLWFDLQVAVLSAPSEIVFHWTVITLAWLLGRATHDHAARARTADRRAAAAVADERARIARELHDVVAHSVSLMVVQAGAATQVAEADPRQARAALETIRRTGVEALSDLRRLLDLVRGEDTPPGGTGLAPQPGTAMLDELVALTRTPDLDVRLDVAGSPRPIAPGVDLTVYRIVQESLTNVRRHSGASRADVRLRYLPDAVQVEVVDDGTGPGTADRAGHGLVGMRERVAVYDGALDVGAGPSGGFRVSAVLPTAGGT
jgi:signal transduction histidine kinase